MNLMHFVQQGRGRPVLLLHPFGLSGRAFMHRIAPYIPKNKFRCIAPDFWGFGDSPALPSSKKHTVAVYADGVVELLDKLELFKVFLVGTSLGGSVGLAMAINYPEKVRALAIQGAPYWGGKFLNRISWPWKPSWLCFSLDFCGMK